MQTCQAFVESLAILLAFASCPVSQEKPPNARGTRSGVHSNRFTFSWVIQLGSVESVVLETSIVPVDLLYDWRSQINPCYE